MKRVSPKTEIIMKRLYWMIRGYDSSTQIFERTVEFGQFTDNQIKHLLRALVAKAGLDNDEMVGAYAKRGTKIANDHLTILKDFESPTYMCGSNPNFVAAVTDENGKTARRSKLT
jgi:hypothetical protein